LTPAEVRDLFAYDRWATERVLAKLDGIDDEIWQPSNVIDERGLDGLIPSQHLANPG
jgi:hypothetical protein